MITIKLHRGKWQYDPDNPLGPPGGFGAVFAGQSDEHPDLAIKRKSLGVSSHLSHFS